MPPSEDQYIYYYLTKHWINWWITLKKNISAKINTTVATSGAGTDYPSGAPVSTPGF